ncbi:hypothetical protein A2W45_00520 [Candidatus Curtissbacteria bacterium RIFCSPHIGHO2_12_41_11]|uniref:Uncharacterized protein n=2 Tax=Candidatus Curtissiibacteriota TaxID=1752717 RepID=A0A1F5H1M8_9BACT|nr:MAG: hypothetical protein A3D07_04430 [Candidatus Curtissbacteria bacterium RIFCSPHIGHO2_02_FULL_42_15]OGD98008.1 MAG: hypothetical protein A2W45_00520 [Candidatus Curtissbacteria bacterium RIFCSPHIGHO2_12_41_11]
MAENQEIFASRLELVREFREFENPTPTPDIDIVWVFSGHSTYDEQLQPSPLAYTITDYAKFFRKEDRQRIARGIGLVKEVTALRLNKDKSEITEEDIQKAGPIFFYNGTGRQNHVLREAIADGKIALPQDKIIISEISPKLDPTPQEANTKTQFEQFPDDLLQKILGHKGKIAIVSHLYHLLRIRRQAKSPNLVAQQPAWAELDLTYFAADPNLESERGQIHRHAAKLLQILRKEGEKVVEYSRKGDLQEI